MAKAASKTKKVAAKSKSSAPARAKAAAPARGRKALAKTAPKPARKVAAKAAVKPAAKPAKPAPRKAVVSKTKAVAAKSVAAPKAGKWVYTFGDGKAEGKAALRDLFDLYPHDLPRLIRDRSKMLFSEALHFGDFVEIDGGGNGFQF